MVHKLSKPTILFHWMTGFCFLGVMALGLIMEEMDRGPTQIEAIHLHKSLGVILVLLASIRLLWRIHEGEIKPVSLMQGWQEVIAKWVHRILLASTIAMPVSGIVMSIGNGRGLDVFGTTLIEASTKIEWLADIGETIHEGALPILFTCLGLHILGALKHQLIDQDGTISRMLGRR